MKKLITTTQLFSGLILVAGTVVGCGAKTYDYYDDRSTLQVTSQNRIQNNISTTVFNPNKHVLLFGIDGVEYKNLATYILPDLNQYWHIQYHIQSYESVYGWSSIMTGNILDRTFNLYDLFNQAYNHQVLKTASLTQWSKFYSSIYHPQTPITHRYEYKDIYNTEYSISKDSDFKNDVSPIMHQWFQEAIQLIHQNYNFIFHYDTTTDELGHLGFNYKDSIYQSTFQILNDFTHYYLNQLGPEWLTIIVTDHGRNPDGQNHSNSEWSAHQSWFVANQNIDQILGYHATNFYDIFTAIANWVTQ